MSRGTSADAGDGGYIGDVARDEDVEIDVDGEIEDTRFLPDPQPSESLSISPTSTTVKLRLPARAKEKEKVPKHSKATKKPKRSVVFSDSEEEFEEPDIVITSDEDFDPQTEFSSGRRRGKGKAGKMPTGKLSGKLKATQLEEEEESEDCGFGWDE